MPSPVFMHFTNSFHGFTHQFGFTLILEKKINISSFFSGSHILHLQVSSVVNTLYVGVRDLICRPGNWSLSSFYGVYLVVKCWSKSKPKKKKNVGQIENILVECKTYVRQKIVKCFTHKTRVKHFTNSQLLSSHAQFTPPLPSLFAAFVDLCHRCHLSDLALLQPSSPPPLMKCCSNLVAPSYNLAQLRTLVDLE